MPILGRKRPVPRPVLPGRAEGVCWRRRLCGERPRLARARGGCVLRQVSHPHREPEPRWWVARAPPQGVPVCALAKVNCPRVLCLRSAVRRMPPEKRSSPCGDVARPVLSGREEDGGVHSWWARRAKDPFPQPAGRPVDYPTQGKMPCSASQLRKVWKSRRSSSFRGGKRSAAAGW